MLLASAAFIGTLYVVSLFFQDARGLSALGAGLSTPPAGRQSHDPADQARRAINMAR